MLGRNVAAVHGSFQPHPLIGVALLSILNLDDGSVLAVPSVSYSAGNEMTLSGGLFLGIGSEGSLPQPPTSEYGSVPTTLYLSLSAFF